jgi:hypothetical protein
MSKISDGKWVWNIQPRDSGALKLTGGQIEVDVNGVHLCHGPGHCGGLIASFPLGTLVWREDLPPVAVQAETLVAGELASFECLPTIAIGSINVTGGTPEGIRALLAEFMAALKEAGPIR